MGCLERYHFISAQIFNHIQYLLRNIYPEQILQISVRTENDKARLKWLIKTLHVFGVMHCTPGNIKTISNQNEGFRVLNNARLEMTTSVAPDPLARVLSCKVPMAASKTTEMGTESLSITKGSISGTSYLNLPTLMKLQITVE